MDLQDYNLCLNQNNIISEFVVIARTACVKMHSFDVIPKGAERNEESLSPIEPNGLYRFLTSFGMTCFT